jgi:hypothetical protein
MLPSKCPTCQVPQEAHSLRALKSVCAERAACEEVAEEFETCILNRNFRKLSALQLPRILKRENLAVSREEAVMRDV